MLMGPEGIWGRKGIRQEPREGFSEVLKRGQPGTGVAEG